MKGFHYHSCYIAHIWTATNTYWRCKFITTIVVMLCIINSASTGFSPWYLTLCLQNWRTLSYAHAHQMLSPEQIESSSPRVQGPGRSNRLCFPWRSRTGAMVARVTSNHKVAGSTPAFGFFCSPTQRLRCTYFFGNFQIWSCGVVV